MKIIIAGASTYGVKNTGDDAMLQVLCSELKHTLNNPKIVFLARHPEKKFDKYFGIKSIKNIEFNNNKESTGKFFYGFNPNDSHEHIKNIIDEIKKSDLVIIGGNSFMEYSENEFLRGVTSYSSMIATLALLHNKPFVLYGVNGHSIKNNLTKQMAKFLCGNAKFVGIRDNAFKLELMNIGIKPKNLKVFTDPAFGLIPINNSTIGKKILKDENIPLDHKFAGVCFRHLYSKWSDQEFEKYAIKLAASCDYIVEKLNLNIIFIPNCIYQSGHPNEDDRKISIYIKNKMKHKSRTHVIMGDLSVNERLSLFPLLEFVVSNRRHVTIFSAIHNIPFLTLGYEFNWHFDNLISDLKMGEYYVNIKNCNSKLINKKIEEVFYNREKISMKLKKIIPKFNKKALYEVKTISELLK